MKAHDFQHAGCIVSGIDEWYPPSPPRRPCASCGTILRQGNSGPMCAICVRRLGTLIEELPKTKPRNQSGYRGVMKNGNKFVAQKCKGGVKKHLGMFNTAEEAHQAWLRA